MAGPHEQASSRSRCWSGSVGIPGHARAGPSRHRPPLTQRRSAMDQQTTDQLRKRLTGEEVALLRQLQELGARHDADGIERPFLEEGFADAGQATAERVNLLTMVKSLRDTLHELQEALPATRLCISCKRAR